MIKINNLTYNYKDVNTFNNFNLYIQKNKFISIAAPNKSGKTTLFNLIIGKLNNKENIILNHSFTNKKYYSKLPPRVGIYQNDIKVIFIKETVYDELSLVLENLNYNFEFIHKRIINLATNLEELDLLNKKVNNLTSTEITKTKILLSLVHDPNIILLDNPFSNLSYKDIEKFAKYLSELNNKTIVLFTNNLEDTIYSDYIYVLNNYKVALEGSPYSLYKEERLINRIGLKLPFMVELSQKLMFYNILDDVYLNMKDLVDVLWK